MNLLKNINSTTFRGDHRISKRSSMVSLSGNQSPAMISVIVTYLKERVPLTWREDLSGTMTMRETLL